MKRISFFSLLISLFLLAACMPADTGAPSYDPYLDRAMGQQAVARSNAAIEATTAAQNYMMEQATLQAAREKNETDLRVTQISAEIQGTQAAVSAQQTQGAATQIADLATQQAISGATATASAFVFAQTPAAATQQALEREIRIGEAAEQRARVMTWVIPIVAVVAILYIAWQIGDYISWKTEIMVRTNNVRESRAGTIIYKDDYWVLLGDEALIRRLNAKSELPAVDPVQFSPGQITASSAPANGDDRSLAIELVRDAIKKSDEGEDGRVIPRWSELGWTSKKWSDAVRWLKEKKAIRTIERVGTFVEYDSLASLLYALETGNISPTPNA